MAHYNQTADDDLRNNAHLTFSVSNIRISPLRASSGVLRFTYKTKTEYITFTFISLNRYG